MKYEIYVNDYELDEDKTVIDPYGVSLRFNDAEDFIMMWNYLKNEEPKVMKDDGEWLVMEPKEVGQYVTEYEVTGETYKLIKEWEAKERERYANNNNNNGDDSDI